MAQNSPAIALRNRLLDAALELVPERGWTSLMIKEAAAAAGLTAGEAELAAPRGPVDLIDAFADRADQQMLEALERLDLPMMKVRERVTHAVRARVAAIGAHKEAARRALAHLALTADAAAAARLTWRTADRVWRALGDRSTDENYYTKRAILSGVLSSVIGVYLVDSGEGHERTWAFLDARIENVMQFERFKGRLKPLEQVGMRAVGLLAALRYQRGAPSRTHS